MIKAVMILSDMIIPLVFAGILLYGISKKVKLYDTFIEGAKDGMQTVVTILPTIIGLMVAVGIIRASGALDMISSLVSPLTDRLGFPTEAVPLTFMRLVSSSASTGLLVDLFKKFGPDSYIGRFVSIMMSCTETVFYTMSVYFLSVKVTKTKYTLAGALLANFAGIVTALMLTNAIYGKG